MTAADQRHHPRVQRPFMVRYRQRGTTGSRWAISTVRNLSTSGVRFAADQPHQVGDALELELQLPASTQPMRVDGRVARTAAGKFGAMELGVAFEGLDALAQRSIEHAVATFRGGR